MKKILVALGFTLAAMSAQANLVYTNIGLTDATNQTNDILNIGSGAVFDYGTLSADAGDVVRFTFLGGVEAGFNNLFVNGLNVLNNSNAGVGSFFDFQVLSSGALNFYFQSGDGAVIPTRDFNGSKNIAVFSNLKGFEDAFVLMLDDSFAAHRDFDDHVIGVSVVSSVPVPAALPLLASALGAFGIARRRNKAKAAK